MSLLSRLAALLLFGEWLARRYNCSLFNVASLLLLFLFLLFLLLLQRFLFLLLQLQLILFSVDFCFLESSPQGKVVEDDPCGDCHIQTRSFLCILWDIHEEVAQFPMNWQHSSALIAQEESSAASKGLRLYGQTSLSNLNSAYPYSLFVEGLLAFLKRAEGFVIDLFVCPLVAEHLELLEYLDLLGVGPIGYEEDFVQSEGAGTPNDISHVIPLANIMQKQVSSTAFRALLLALHQQ